MTTARWLRSQDLLADSLDSKTLARSHPPTEDDLPYDDGEPMETQRHREQMIILIDTLKHHWKDSRGYYIGGNMFLHYDLSDKRRFRGPDVFLVLDVDPRERKSWVVWQEGGRYPDVIVELLSDTTRRIDKTDKKDLYEQVFQTSEYYLYDPFSLEFTGYRLAAKRYMPVLPDARSRIFSPATGLMLGIHDGWLRWMTKDGTVLPTGMELAERERQRAEQERQRAELEKRRAEQAESRLMKTARQMLSNGYSYHEIRELTGISKAEIVG